MNTKNKELPNKLHDLLAIALHDLSIVEVDPKFKINMDHWYIAQKGEPCSVCLAGAVMSQHIVLDFTNSTTVIPGKVRSDPSQHGDVGRKLHAINYLRIGAAGAAFRELNPHRLIPEEIDRIYSTEEVNNLDFLSNRLNRTEWKTHMYLLLEFLKSEDI